MKEDVTDGQKDISLDPAQGVENADAEIHRGGTGPSANE
jgi:hypothetical protein